MGFMFAYIFTRLVATAIVVAVVQRTRSWFRLRHFPGPVFASFLEWWHLKHVLGGRMHLDTAEVCEKYGPIVRIGPNELVTNDVETWRKVMNVRTAYTRSNWFDSLQLKPGCDNIVSQRDNAKHAALRSKMAPGYSGKENLHLEHSIDINIANFISLIDKKYLSTDLIYKPMDLARKIQFFTLDTIADIAFGKQFGFLEHDEDRFSYIEKTEESLGAMMTVTVLPWLIKLLHSPIMRSVLPSEKDPIGLGKMMGIARDVVGERFGPNKKEQMDMLGSFIRHGLTHEEAESESLMQIIAGSDTTATTLRVLILYLLSSPQVYARLLSEIAETKTSQPITDAEARSMPYLQAIIKEGLRIHPPVTGLLFKEVPRGGDTLNGLFLPEGTKLGWSVWGAMRDKSFWGEDARIFRPERWLVGSPDQIKERESRVEMVFSYGKWQCLGKEVGKIELNKVLVELLRHYDFTTVNPQNPWKSYNMALFIQSDMWVRVNERQPRL